VRDFKKSSELDKFRKKVLDVYFNLIFI